MERLLHRLYKIQLLFLCVTPIFLIGIKLAEALPSTLFLILFFGGWFLYSIGSIVFVASIIMWIIIAYVLRTKQYGIGRVFVEVAFAFLFTLCISIGITVVRDHSLTYYNSLGLVSVLTIVYCAIMFCFERKESNR